MISNIVINFKLGLIIFIHKSVILWNNHKINRKAKLL